jgi:hypothetical protein
MEQIHLLTYGVFFASLFYDDDLQSLDELQAVEWPPINHVPLLQMAPQLQDYNNLTA